MQHGGARKRGSYHGSGKEGKGGGRSGGGGVRER